MNKCRPGYRERPSFLSSNLLVGSFSPGDRDRQSQRSGFGIKVVWLVNKWDTGLFQIPKNLIWNTPLLDLDHFGPKSNIPTESANFIRGMTGLEHSWTRLGWQKWYKFWYFSVFSQLLFWLTEIWTKWDKSYTRGYLYNYHTFVYN